MKTPNEVLSYFIESLEQEQQFEFSMKHWFQDEDYATVTPYEVENTCGTSACIAGTVAYRLNPKSTESCFRVIERWVGISVLSEPTSWVTDEHNYVESVLDGIFTDAYLYGEEYLADVTKEQALTVLNKLLKESHDTWESLHESMGIVS